MCVWVVARLPQRLRSMFFEKKNFTPGPGSSSGTLHSNFFQKTLILAFETNSVMCIVLTKWIVFRVLAHFELLKKYFGLIQNFNGPFTELLPSKEEQIEE